MSPVREAKSRTLSREYMADHVFMTEYSPAEREWYLLTALFADDDGYLPWDLIENAANLYRYEAPAEREARVTGYVEHFTRTGRFIDLGCGHARMPSVAKHPRGREREYRVRDEHSMCTSSALDVHSPPFRSVPFLSGSSPIPAHDERLSTEDVAPDASPSDSHSEHSPSTAPAQPEHSPSPSKGNGVSRDTSRDGLTTCPRCGDLLSDRDPNVAVLNRSGQLGHVTCPDTTGVTPP